VSTADILSEISANAAVEFGDALSLPPAAYHDEGVLELETERLFRQEWICIGRLAEMPNPGDYICRDIVDTPVFAIRQKNGETRAFANVCLHRSARLLDGCGHVSRISCPYHSWTYEPDGQLIAAPFMKDAPGFDAKDWRLRELACECWQGFVYVALAADPTPLGDTSSGLSSLIDDFRIADYVSVYEHEELWRANWKCLVENYMDAYHIHRVHRDSFAKYGSSEDLTLLYPGDEAYSYHVVQETAERHSVYAHPDNDRVTGDDRFKTLLIHIFPSHVMQLQPDMLWYLSILPAGVDRLTVRWAVSIPREILDDAPDRQAVIDERMKLIHQVNDEDRPIVENVYRATKSSLATRGPLSWLERNVWDFGRYLARRLTAWPGTTSG
jgi:choline monooxygenase